MADKNTVYKRRQKIIEALSDKDKCFFRGNDGYMQCKEKNSVY